MNKCDWKEDPTNYYDERGIQFFPVGYPLHMICMTCGKKDSVHLINSKTPFECGKKS